MPVRRRKPSELEFNLESLRYLKRKMKLLVRFLERMEKDMVKFKSRPPRASKEEIEGANLLYQGGADLRAVMSESRKALKKAIDESA